MRSASPPPRTPVGPRGSEWALDSWALCVLAACGFGCWFAVCLFGSVAFVWAGGAVRGCAGALLTLFFFKKKPEPRELHA